MEIYSQEEVDSFKVERTFPMDSSDSAAVGAELFSTKILYLYWDAVFLSSYQPSGAVCSRFVCVSSAKAPMSLLASIKDCRTTESAVILESRGMADSIYRAVPDLSTPFTLVVWGDQVALRPETIRSIMKIQQSNPQTKLALPIAQRENPYVHYERDAAGNFINVLQRREGDIMPVVGESDCGVFAFNTKRLQEVFQQEIEKGITLSEITKEWNFLPMPSVETGDASVFCLDSLEETIGVNDMNDVAILEKYFSKSLVK
jgi:bifunctional N-acetylglucosamine-1-phosphate-uridyltransferase/glucosamine-1-phosphate-acetyltransferase GlmU-like protein